VATIRDSGGHAIAVQADVSEEAEVVRLFETTDRELGRVTALVNNAATLEAQTRLDSVDAARSRRLFSVNVIGSILCAREAVRRMSTRYGGSGGAIVNVFSGAARSGSPGEYIDYAATKGAIDTMTVGLAREEAEEGIRVNGVRPGFIYTGLHAKGGEPRRVDRVKSWYPCKEADGPRKWRPRFSGCCPRRLRTPRARSSISRAGYRSRVLPAARGLRYGTAFGDAGQDDGRPVGEFGDQGQAAAHGLDGLPESG
jgi:NAD(P)-dependent dehydrogenase (short-subunit alcohol dehydrogenase family)